MQSLACINLTKEQNMKTNNTPRFHCIRTIVCLTSSFFLTEIPSQAAQTGGLPALAERVAELETLVSAQSNQITSLLRALDAEMRARMEEGPAVLAASTNFTLQRVAAEAAAREAGDATLQAQITNIQAASFSEPEISTLRALANSLTVTPATIYFSSSLSIGGDVAVADGHTLLINRIEPIGSNGLGNPTGRTVFAGDVGVTAANSLFVNRITAFEWVHANECPGVQIGMGQISTACRGNGWPTNDPPNLLTSRLVFGY
jgi:hypothetical protein